MKPSRYKCTRCGSEWTSRQDKKPQYCAGCNSQYWDRPRSYKQETKTYWNKQSIKALRRHLELTQAKLSQELGTRQQTISEWETGMYRPRGTAATLLTLVAERSGFKYSPQGKKKIAD